jgi:uncharacterized Zn finger protein (UPF0148 family)
MTSNNKTIQKTGELLLSGWKMLAIHCPICNAPIMSKAEAMKCPGCDMPVQMERTSSNSEAVLAPIPPPPKLYEDISSDEAKNILPNYDAVEVPQSMEELRREYDNVRAKRDTISSKLGEKMLLGWVMLADICPSSTCEGTPLMREPGTKDMLCVCCNKKYVKDQYDDIRVEQTVSLPAKETMAIAKDSAATTLPTEQEDKYFKFDIDSIPILSFEKVTDDDKVSKLISEKLLKGWAMLDKVCADCNGSTPLLRDHEKKVGSLLAFRYLCLSITLPALL